MSKLIDVTGDTYGRLKVLHYTKDGWKCQCSCGSTKIVVGPTLRAGKVQSCGCLHRETAYLQGKSNCSHGMTGSPTYTSWQGMKQRCHYQNHNRFEYYGARGITVCDRWFNSFEDFYNDMGLRPEGMSIDRIDNDGNYEPSNCKWSTPEEQAYNRSDNIKRK